MVRPNIVGVDIETTGKHPREPGKIPAILSLGVIVFDRTWQEIAAKEWIVAYNTNDLEVILEGMDPEVHAMHMASGLISQLRRASELLDDTSPHAIGRRPTRLSEVEREAIEFIAAQQGAGSPMFGSSVHFERKWLDVFMPKLNALFHYRNLDASSLAEMAKLDDLKLHRGKEAKVSKHSTLSDVRDSAALARLAWGYGYGWTAVWHHVKATWGALWR